MRFECLFEAWWTCPTRHNSSVVITTCVKHAIPPYEYIISTASRVEYTHRCHNAYAKSVLVMKTNKCIIHCVWFFNTGNHNELFAKRFYIGKLLKYVVRSYRRYDYRCQHATAGRLCFGAVWNGILECPAVGGFGVLCGVYIKMASYRRCCTRTVNAALHKPMLNGVV